MSVRKAIAAALLSQLAPEGGDFPTSGRRVSDPNTLSGGEFPALFLIKTTESYSYDGEGDTVPPTRTLDFHAVIFTDYSADQSAVPADAIDDLLDGVDAALAPSVVDQFANQGRQTLGGLVYNAVIVGDPDIATGDEQGKGEVTIPIRVTLKDYP